MPSYLDFKESQIDFAVLLSPILRSPIACYKVDDWWYLGVSPAMDMAVVTRVFLEAWGSFTEAPRWAPDVLV
jgi:hypothetical protein